VSDQLLQVLKYQWEVKSLLIRNGLAWWQLKEQGGVLDVLLQAETAGWSKQSLPIGKWLR